MMHEMVEATEGLDGSGSVGFGFQNAGLTATDATPQTDFVSLSYWRTGAMGFGHIGIGVNTDETLGYATADPEVRWYRRLFGAAAGRMEDDRRAHMTAGKVAEHSVLHIPISAAQASAMCEEMAYRMARPGRYNLIFNNCDAFVEGVLRAGGVSGFAAPRNLWDHRLWRRVLSKIARGMCLVFKGRPGEERGAAMERASPDNAALPVPIADPVEG